MTVYFLYLDVSLGAQFDHYPHFVEAMTVAVDPNLAAEAADSTPVGVAVMERQVDTVAGPSLAVEMAADPNPAALVVVDASPVPGVETANSSLVVPVVAVPSPVVEIAAADSSPAVLAAVDPSLAERLLAVRQLLPMPAMHAQYDHCGYDARYTRPPKLPGQPG